MKNILIVCPDKDLRKDLSKALSKELKCLYLDADELLDFEILNRQDIALTEARDALHEMEAETLRRVTGFKNCIITISHSLFVANDNFDLLKDLRRVNIVLPKSYLIAKTRKEDKYKLEQELCLYNQINALVSANCDVTIEKDVISIPEMCQKIIFELNK